MKKIFAILACFVLLVSLCLPFSASATEVTSAIGEWTWNSTRPNMSALSSISELDSYGYYNIPFVATVYDGEEIAYTSTHLQVGQGNTQLNFVHKGGIGTLYYNKWRSDNLSFVVHEEVSPELLNWLLSNATKLEEPEEPEVFCDGSACSWADDDYNGVCDTCGYALMSFRYDLLQYAYDVKDGIYEEYQYWVILEEPIAGSTNVSYTILKSLSPFKYSYGGLWSDTDYLKVSVGLDSDGVPYSGWWSTVDGETRYLYRDAPSGSSHDIDGFFPLGLRQMIQEVVESELVQLTDKVVGTMKILVACGVGLMACLAVFALFGKRSLLSLKK